MGLDKPDRLPDQLLDDGRAEGCTELDTPEHSLSAGGLPERHRAGFGTKRSAAGIEACH